MKVLQIASLSTIANAQPRQTAEVQGDIRVIEKPHNICQMDQVPAGYKCDEVDGRTVCEAPCNGGYKRYYCECYRKIGFILLYDTDKCAWNDFNGHCFKDGNNFLEQSQMQNDYAPVELEEVEEEEEILQCKNDTKLKWNCDNSDSAVGTSCTRTCPSGDVAERVCNCDDGTCDWEYKLPSIDCMLTITDHHRKAHREHQKAQRTKKVELKKEQDQHKEELIQEVMSHLSHDAVAVDEPEEVEEEVEEESVAKPNKTKRNRPKTAKHSNQQETTSVAAKTQEMADRVLMIKDQVDEVAIRTFLEDLESFDKMTLITITNGLLSKDD